MKNVIESAWENRSILKEPKTQDTIREVINQLDEGKLRVAEPSMKGWKVNEWIKKAVVLYFPIQKMKTLEAGPLEFYDKIPLKTGYQEKGIRVVPHAVSRHGAFISKGVIMMPSFVNIGAFVDSGTMVGNYNNISVIAGCGHDTACAFAATPVKENKKSAILSSGTWSLLGCELSQPIINNAVLKNEFTNEEIKRRIQQF